MARKSRKNLPQDLAPAVSTVKYKCALYARISVENEQKREADTIGNQIALLRDYVSQYPDLVEYDLYCDDDISGVSFSRPEFARMMNDIRLGRVNCVIVKDLSRLGRNMLESGEYIEQIFPRLNTRFIAVTDRFDTLKGDADISIQLKNFANEAYARDISKKIRAVKSSQQLAGQWTSGTPPYGYMIDPDDKYHLIPDPNTAPIVLAIFRMVSEDNSLHCVAKTMNEQGVPSPGKYLYNMGLRKADKFKNSIWYMTTLKKILKDQVYLGWVVLGKTKSLLCVTGEKKSIEVPQEEWIIKKGMHEPIVPKALFDSVQETMKQRKEAMGQSTTYDSQSKRRSIFKGILRCGECGRGMYLRRKSNGKHYYFCSLHEHYGAATCTKKAVRQEDVESLALRLIQNQIALFTDAQKLIADLNATKSSQTRYQIYSSQIEDAKRKIEKFTQLKASLYGDMAEGLLSHEEYSDLSDEYSQRADELRIFIAELEKERQKFDADYGKKTQWVELIEKYGNQAELNEEMVAAFLENLTLYNDGHVEVTFKHRMEFDQILYIAATKAKEADRVAG